MKKYNKQLYLKNRETILSKKREQSNNYRKRLEFSVNGKTIIILNRHLLSSMKTYGVDAFNYDEVETHTDFLQRQIKGALEELTITESEEVFADDFKFRVKIVDDKYKVSNIRIRTD